MITVIAIDALEFDLVENFDMKNMKLSYYGKTDISEFSEPRTMVLWSSFMTGENKEEEVLALGDKEMWHYKIPHEQTFFSKFENPKIIDLPGYNYDLDQHKKERDLLKAFFKTEVEEEKIATRKQYNAHCFDHHRAVKNDFLSSLDKEHDLLLGYFSVADVIGHLNFGKKAMMKMIYRDLDEIIAIAKDKRPGNLIVLSDHGMEPIGQFGDHSNYGFWSTNFKNLGLPKITDFADIILKKADIW